MSLKQMESDKQREFRDVESNNKSRGFCTAFQQGANPGRTSDAIQKRIQKAAREERARAEKRAFEAV